MPIVQVHEVLQIPMLSVFSANISAWKNTQKVDHGGSTYIYIYTYEQINKQTHKYINKEIINNQIKKEINKEGKNERNKEIKKDREKERTK